MAKPDKKISAAHDSGLEAIRPPQEAEAGKDKGAPIEKVVQNLTLNTEELVKAMKESEELVKAMKESEELVKAMKESEELVKAMKESEELVKAMKESSEELVKTMKELIQSNKEKEEDWTSAPTYSKWINDYVGAHTPFEQIGVYVSTFGGIIYGAKSLVKSKHLMQASKALPGTPEREAHMTMGWLTDHELQYAVHYHNKFIAKGIAGAIGAPLLWLSYVWSKEKQRDSNAVQTDHMQGRQEPRFCTVHADI